MRGIASSQCSALNRMEETAIQTPRWLTKDEAAEILKISPRRVLEYVQAGALVSQIIRDPKTNQMTKQIDAADVARLREERENPRPQPSQTPQVVALQGSAIVRKPAGRPSSQTLALREHAEPQPSALPLSELRFKIFLSEDEAARYSGMSKSLLRIHVQAHKVGPRGAIAYRRVDIEAV